jgi:hypothetical protein
MGFPDTRFNVNLSILFTELPLLERPAAAKQAGFGAVEFWWPFVEAVPPDRHVDAFVSAIEDAGVQLTGLNFFAGDMPGGDRGLVSWPKRSGEFRDNIDVTIGIGERLGCRGFNALYGNREDGHSASEQDDLAVENLSLAAGHVAGEEVQAGQLHAGVLDRGHERIDVPVRRHCLDERPPELDGAEPGPPGRRRALQQRQLGEEQRAVHRVAVAHGISAFRIAEVSFCSAK